MEKADIYGNKENIRKEYYPATLCQNFLEDFQIEPGMNPLEIKKIVFQKNLILKEEADLVISAITLSGWAETKQAYRCQ